MSNEYAGFASQYAEIIERVANGTLQGSDVRGALQAILEGRFFPAEIAVATSGSWAVSPRNQIARLLKLSDQYGWGFTHRDIPKVPKFKPASSTERLLLAVYFEPEDGLTTFKKWSEVFSAPEGLTKWVWPEMQIDEQHMKLIGIAPKSGIRWVAFDPCANWTPKDGRRVTDLWGNPLVSPTLASSEALMALAYDPTWALRWDGTEVPYPDLAGWRYSYSGDDVWQCVPYLYRWDDGSQVELFVYGAGNLNQRWSAAAVRELL